MARGSRFLRGLAAGNQVDDVSRCEGRIGDIGRSQLIERAAHRECQVVLLDGRRHRHVQYRVRLVGVVKSDQAALQLVADVAVEQFSRCQCRATRDHGIGGCASNVERHLSGDADLRADSVETLL